MTAKTFDELVFNGKSDVLIEFYAPWWVGLCKGQLAPQGPAICRARAPLGGWGSGALSSATASLSC